MYIKNIPKNNGIFFRWYSITVVSMVWDHEAGVQFPLPPFFINYRMIILFYNRLN